MAVAKEVDILGEATVEHEQSHTRGFILLVLSCCLLLFSMAVSIAVGAADIHLSTVWESIFHFNENMTSHQIIHDLRIPRVVAATVVGAFLGISGAIMQGMTRNPLADPSLMGVTAGAGFAVALAFAFFPSISGVQMMMLAFCGAGIGVGLVFGIGALSKGGLTPVKLALAGASVGALLTSLSSAIAIHFDVARNISFWFVGGVAGVQWSSVQLLLAVAMIGIPLALIIARSITILSLGEEVARGLGQKTFLVKCMGTAIVLLLTGAAVAIAGSIGFIGLIIPHITRMIIGGDYRWVIPCSAVTGGLLMVLSDIGGRMIDPPFETPVGAITAIIGAPFFLYLARREGRGW